MKVHSFTRRNAIGYGAAGLGLITLSGCAKPPLPSGTASGMVIMQGDDIIYEHAQGLKRSANHGDKIRDLGFDTRAPFRVASMSKPVVMLTARELVRQGLLAWDMDIQISMGIPMRHPQYPDTPITLAQLIGHTSLIKDPPIYWLSAPNDIRTLVTPDIFNPGATRAPGQYFTYANVNYGFAATIMEVVTGERFDHLATRLVLKPLGLDAGFNWSGVSAMKRAKGATLSSGSTIVDSRADLMARKLPLYAPDDYDDANYPPGQNGALFSPQGGLRASLRDLAKLVGYLHMQADLNETKWIYDGKNGASEDNHFLRFGQGVYLLPEDQSPLPGHKLIGHVGFAYGMVGGMWSDGEYSFAYADIGAGETGGAMTGRTPNISVTAARYFDQVKDIIDT